MYSSPSNQLLGLLERYGFFILAIFALNLHAPDFSPSVALMDLDISLKNETRSSGNIIRQIFYITLLLGYTACIFGRRSAIKHITNQKSIFINFGIIIGLCALSSSWSDFTLLSLKRTALQCIIILVVYFSVYFSIQRNTFSKSILALFFLFLVTSIISLSTGTAFVNGAFTGWASSKNNYGSWVLFIVFMLTLRLSFDASGRMNFMNKPSKNQLFQYWLLQPILLLLLILSGSKTSLTLALICQFSVLKLKIPFRGIAYISIASMLCVFLMPVFFENAFGERYNLAMMLTGDTLTGRGAIWGLLYSNFDSPKNLLLGSGFATYFNTGTTPDALNIENSYLQYLNSAHNAYLELSLQLGIPIAIAIILLLGLIVKNIKLKSSLIICWLIFVYNITESAFLRDQHIMWLAFIVALSVDSSYRNKSSYVINKTQLSTDE